MSQNAVQEVTKASPKNHGTSNKLNKPRLITIDDELKIATLVAEIAESIGFETEVATNAQQFLQSWKERQHDVIVIDLFMPDTDGFELINMLADQRCSAAIIMISGHDKAFLDSSSMLAKGLNVRNTFTKPLQIDKIKAVFKEIYDERS